MHLHKLPEVLVGYQWVGVAGLLLGKPLNIDKLLKDLQSASRRWETPVQVSEARTLCGPIHAIHAANLALKAHAAKRNRAKRIEIEILLYLSGKRQIGEAIQSIGVKKGSKEIAIIAVGPSQKAVRGTLTDVQRLLPATKDDKVLLMTGRKKKAVQTLFEISDDELSLVTGGGGWKEGFLKCVMERAAMVDALKK